MPAINPIVLNSLSDLQPALYWLDADPLEPDSHSSLTSEIETDLCIVGAGYTGLWTALLAKERDPKREVVIIEQRETGNGASGRNETIKKYKIDCDFERNGELRVAVAPWQMAGLKEEAVARNKTGDQVEVLSKEEIRALVKSPIYEGALFDHDGTALVDPARLVWGLEKVCLSLGVKIYENSKVEELIQDGEQVIVKSAYGSIRANKVALATNI